MTVSSAPECPNSKLQSGIALSQTVRRLDDTIGHVPPGRPLGSVTRRTDRQIASSLPQSSTVHSNHRRATDGILSSCMLTSGLRHEDIELDEGFNISKYLVRAEVQDLPWIARPVPHFQSHGCLHASFVEKPPIHGHPSAHPVISLREILAIRARSEVEQFFRPSCSLFPYSHRPHAG